MDIILGYLQSSIREFSIGSASQLQERIRRQSAAYEVTLDSGFEKVVMIW